ncbi:uncharacterized protein LOC144615661 isoform X2 [Panthera onca]
MKTSIQLEPWPGIQQSKDEGAYARPQARPSSCRGSRRLVSGDLVSTCWSWGRAGPLLTAFKGQNSNNRTNTAGNLDR